MKIINEEVYDGFTKVNTKIMNIFQLVVQASTDALVQSLTICAKFCRGPSCENHVALPYAPCEAEMPRMPFLGVSSLDLGRTTCGPFFLWGALLGGLRPGVRPRRVMLAFCLARNYCEQKGGAIVAQR
jgi:hypothetical protein